MSSNICDQADKECDKETNSLDLLFLLKNKTFVSGFSLPKTIRGYQNVFNGVLLQTRRIVIV